jgi:ATP-dependent Clp protease ATP-binding subunit ClpA
MKKYRLKTLRDDIKKFIFGQDEAIDRIVDADPDLACRAWP